jgi:hypothetical protein
VSKLQQVANSKAIKEISAGVFGAMIMAQGLSAMLSSLSDFVRESEN